MEEKENSTQKKYKLSNIVLIILTILSFILFIFGVLHIPILSSLGVKVFPNRNPFWAIPMFIVVIICAIPLSICIEQQIKCHKNKH